jgi:ribose 5-phosphate isomerase A
MKTNAALKAFELLQKKFTHPFTIGLGSGSTSEIFVKILMDNAHALPPFRCVASSKKIAAMASHTLHFMEDEMFEYLDVYVDGADEVALDHNYTLIKGGGGCLTREKILFSSSKLQIIMVDETKLSHGMIGNAFKKIPVEILPFGSTATIRKIGLPGKVRENFVTDQGAIIYDLQADVSAKILQTIRTIPGVVEVGLFNHPRILIVAHALDVEVIHVP